MISKPLKITGGLLAGLFLILLLAAATVFLRSNSRLSRTFAVKVRSIPIPSDAAALARGRHLAQTRGCLDCHGPDLGGAKVIDDGAMGLVHGPNLTRGQGGRVAGYRDEDWVRAIRHGIGRDGRGFFLMPSEEYAALSDADLGALIAHLKSVPAVNRSAPAVALGPVARTLLVVGKLKLAAETIDHANVRPPNIVPGVTVEYGRYVGASCTGCHGPNYSGGKIEVGPPNWPPAANLTPHSEGRLAKWTEADFIAAIRTGKRPDGSAINPVMPRGFGAMDDTELKALWAYFKTLPAAATGAR